jgi:hypothetical protein
VTFIAFFKGKEPGRWELGYDAFSILALPFLTLTWKGSPRHAAGQFLSVFKHHFIAKISKNKPYRLS